jgi:hypothetical protein
LIFVFFSIRCHLPLLLLLFVIIIFRNVDK